MNNRIINIPIEESDLEMFQNLYDEIQEPFTWYFLDDQEDTIEVRFKKQEEQE